MLCWGAAYVPSAWLVEDLPPFTAAAARLGVAGVLLLVVLRLAGRPVAPGVGAAPLAWLGLTQTAIFYGATFWGIAHAGAGLAAVLANSDPLFVAALGAVFLAERLTRRQWTGMVVGFVGVAIAVSPAGLFPPEVSVDALVVVLGALAWAVGTIVATRGVRGAGEPLALAGWQMVAGAFMLAVLAAATEGDGVVTARTVALVVVLAAAGSAAPLALFYTALVRAPAGEVSAWFFLVPVVGLLTAWPLLGETPGASLIVAMVAVAGGLWLVLARPARPGRRWYHRRAPMPAPPPPDP